jgi:hypothetical protein
MSLSSAGESPALHPERTVTSSITTSPASLMTRRALQRWASKWFSSGGRLRECSDSCAVPAVSGGILCVIEAGDNSYAPATERGAIEA